MKDDAATTPGGGGDMHRRIGESGPSSNVVPRGPRLSTGRLSPAVWSSALAALVIIAAIAVLAPAAAVVGMFAAAVVIAAVLIVFDPTWALIVFTIGLPLHNFLMALLYDVTGSHLLVKVAQPWKEALLALALARAVVPVILQIARTRQVRLRPHLVDLLVAAFALVALVSVALPNAIIPLGERVLGARDLLVPFVAYVIGRLVPLSARLLRVWLGVLASMVILLSLSAIGERLFWGHALFLAVNYGRYLADFLGQQFPFAGNTPFTFYADGFLPRAGSLALGPLDLSVFLMVALPILLAAVPTLRSETVAEGPLGRGAGRLWGGYGFTLVACALGGCALILAWGRASLVLVGAAMIVLVLVQSPRRQWRGMSVLLAGCLVGLVLVAASAAQVASVATEPQQLAIADHGLVPTALGAHYPPEAVATSTSPATTSNPFSPTPPSTPTTTSQTGGAPSGGASAILQQSFGFGDSSTQSHLSSLKGLLHLMLRQPLGVGIGAAGQVGVRSGVGVAAESSYFTVGVDLGLPGLLLYAAVFLCALLTGWRAWRRTHAAGSREGTAVLSVVFLGATVAWAAVIVNGVVAEVTLDLFAMWVLWWVLGVAVASGVRGAVGDGADPSAHPENVLATHDAHWHAVPRRDSGGQR